ncbi:MAG TPA: dihydroorotate dehydrogenase [Gemmatimonadales bacterium]|nr:dihydroorotate dehydrogenase [Gemmatimonadales bacterium]
MTGTLARNVLGVTFQNPVLLASGTAGYGRELDGVMDLEALGGIVTKAVSLEPRRGNAAPRVGEFPGGMINSVGLANPGLGAVRQHDLPWLAGHISKARVLVNVVGFREEEYAAVVSGLDAGSGFVAYELNLSCPNTAKGGIEFGAEPESVARIVGSVRKVTKRPIFAKLSPVLPDVATMACAARDAGADGVSLVNTMPGYLYDGDRPRLGQGNGGISGPALRPVGLLAVRRVAERTSGDLPIIGVGGVSTAEHVREYLRSGASLVAIGTAALADPRLPGRIVKELERG